MYIQEDTTHSFLKEARDPSTRDMLIYTLHTTIYAGGRHTTLFPKHDVSTCKKTHLRVKLEYT